MQLKSTRLTVEIATPGSLYRGSRFDWTGFITQVTLDERHSFCAPESLTPGGGTGGAGLCSEFGIFSPIGYAETAPRGRFLKLGVGILTRPDQEAYSFARPYSTEPLPVVTERAADSVRFTTLPVECNGYEARLTRTISVAQNQINVACQLKNTGSRLIQTDEYCHNFVAFNSHPIGPEYQLRFPYRPVADRLPDLLTAGGHQITWREAPGEPFFCRLTGFGPEPGLRWELLHKPSGLAMREYGDFPTAGLTLWGTSHVVSPEVFVHICLPPGETLTWSRTFVFMATPDDSPMPS